MARHTVSGAEAQADSEDPAGARIRMRSTRKSLPVEGESQVKALSSCRRVVWTTRRTRARYGEQEQLEDRKKGVPGTSIVFFLWVSVSTTNA